MSNADRLQLVELVPAFSWACESCGAENFSRSVVAEFSEEEMEELRREHGVQPWEAGHFVQKPTIVECCRCHQKFGTIDYNEEEEDD